MIFTAFLLGSQPKRDGVKKNWQACLLCLCARQAKSFSADLDYRADKTMDFIRNLISKRILILSTNCSPNFLEFAKLFTRLVLMLKDI